MNDRPPKKSAFEIGLLAEFIRHKLSDAEKSLKIRMEMEQVWRSGTNKSWDAARPTKGKRWTKSERLKESAMHGRIALRLQREVEMFKAVLNELTP